MHSRLHVSKPLAAIMAVPPRLVLFRLQHVLFADANWASLWRISRHLSIRGFLFILAPDLCVLIQDIVVVLLAVLTHEQTLLLILHCLDVGAEGPLHLLVQLFELLVVVLYLMLEFGIGRHQVDLIS